LLLRSAETIGEIVGSIFLVIITLRSVALVIADGTSRPVDRKLIVVGAEAMAMRVTVRE